MPIFPDVCIPTSRQRLDEINGLRYGSRFQNLIISRIGPPIEDVVSYRAGEKSRILRDQAMDPRRHFQGQALHIVAIKKHFPGYRVVQTHHEAHHGGFPAPVEPTIPIDSPGCTERVKLSYIGLRPGYVNVTSRYSIAPETFSISISPSTIPISVSSRSKTRVVEAFARW